MPVTSLVRKRCLLTGAASGIGRATALLAARRGAELFLTDVAAAGLEERPRGPRPGRRRRLLARPRRHRPRGGRRDGGRGPRRARQPRRGDERRRDLVSSSAGLLGLPWHAAYSAAKFGLRGVSEVLRFDLARHDIGVTLVWPGGVRTPLVGTVEIVGIDNEHPEVQKLKREFERRALTPERAAEKIVEGIEKDRYLVFTSNDIRLVHLLQRFFPPAYEMAMRSLNRRLVAVAERSRR